MIPDDGSEASAAAELAADIGAARVSVASDGSPYQELVASQFTGAAADAGIEVVGAGGSPEATLTPNEDGSLQLRGKGEYEISAALDPAELPGSSFPAEFRSSFGREPGPYAAYGYEAMSLALEAIGDAEKGEDFRPAVVSKVLDAERPDSILGRYSITEDGDSTLCAVQPYSLEGSRRVPDKPICPPG